MTEHSRNLRLVDATLKRARKYHLEVEVMWSALSAAKREEVNEHGKSFEQVLEEALSEWDLDKEGMGQ